MMPKPTPGFHFHPTSSEITIERKLSQMIATCGVLNRECVWPSCAGARPLRDRA